MNRMRTEVCCTVFREGNIAAWSRRQALGEDGEIKAPPSAGRMWLWELKLRRRRKNRPAIRFAQDVNCINDPSAICFISCKDASLAKMRVRPLAAKRPDQRQSLKAVAGRATARGCRLRSPHHGIKGRLAQNARRHFGRKIGYKR